MARLARQDSASGIHHITARGVGRHIIFEDDIDRKALFDTLSRILDEMDVRLYAWCFMRNHVHLLIRGKLENVSKFMQRILTSYSIHYNNRHDHVGHVFQGRFSSNPIETDEHFLMALCYIHQNPYRSGETQTYDFRWSSYREYTHSLSDRICETNFALELFGGIKSFVRFHEDHLATEASSHDKARAKLSDAAAQKTIEAIVGPDFSTSIALLPKEDRDRQIRALRTRGLSIKQIERLTGIGRNIIQRAK